MNRLKWIFIFMLIAGPLFAEPKVPSPYGNKQSKMPPAEFDEEDVFDDEIPTPPPVRNRRNTPLPTRTTPKRNTVKTPKTPSQVFQSSNTPQAKKPRLADYLKLDPSIQKLEVKSFDFVDKEIRDVVTLISKWTGKNFILDQKVRGKITILGPSEVTVQEAYQAFLSALAANGLTTIQKGKYIRIIEQGEARRSPVPTYTGASAPTDDNFITRIFQLQYISADEVQREFRDMTTRQGKLFAYEPTNSIIITDTGSNIQRIKDILESLDVKSFETTLHVLPIKNGSSKAISQMLSEIYSGGQSKSGSRRSFRRNALERTRGGGIISKIVPDDATNSLVVLANKTGMETLRRLVNKLDVRISNSGKIHVYYCNYAKAEDLAQTLASLAGGGGPTTSRSRSRSSRTNRGGRNSRRTSTRTAPRNAAPVTAELGEGVKITSDAATNSLVITANSSDYNTLKRVLKKLDIPRLQVFVEGAIIEVTIDDTDRYGTSALVAGSPDRPVAGGFIGDGAGILNYLRGNVPEGASIPIFAGPKYNPPFFTSAGTSGNVSTSGFMGLLNFVTSDSNSQILSTPQILALDNEEAEFKVQDETPVQTDFTVSTGTAGSTPGQGRIEVKKTGIAIKLTPHVNRSSRSIRMDIEQKVDTIRPNVNVPQALQNVQVATTTRETNTSVIVKDGDYMMLGGLISDKVTESTKKVPLLGDIPILGWLFKRRTYEKNKSNLVILLRPRIIDTQAYGAGNAIIRENLGGRDNFIKENFDGKDVHKEKIKEIKKQTSGNTPRTGPTIDDFPQSDEVARPRPGEQSQIGASTTEAEKSLANEEPIQNTKSKASQPLLEDNFEDSFDSSDEAAEPLIPVPDDANSEG